MQRRLAVMLLLLMPGGTCLGQAALAETLLDSLAAGHTAYLRERFTDDMRTKLPEGQLQAIWGQLEQAYGPLSERGEPRETEAAGHPTVILPVRFGEQQWFNVRMSFDGANRLAGLFIQPGERNAQAYSLPGYADSTAFTERKQSVESGRWQLGGTLALPHEAKAGKPVPGVVLVHGSGPHDRDETIGPNKPFRDLAAGLASRGIAVLRYEKRTKAYPSQMAQPTVQQTTNDDALAAVRILQNQPEVDSSRVFLLGHSLGGNQAPRIASRDSSIAGVILLAANARPLEELVLEQMAYVRAQAPEDAPGFPSRAELERQVARVQSDTLSASAPADSLPLGLPARFWLSLRGYDPVETLRRLPVPALVLQGERDYQVTMADFRRYEQGLAGKANAITASLPGLNHLFMAGEDPSTPAEYNEPGHVARQVIELVHSFVRYN